MTDAGKTDPPFLTIERFAFSFVSRCAVALYALLLASAPGVAGSTTASFNDPAAYCAAIGTIDRPDGRYVGEPVPDWVARALMRATGAPADAPLQFFKQAVWRCHDGQVLGCSFGANIPCDTKADQSRTPGPGTRQFCADNPNSDIVPAYATGRATVFAWRCQGTRPVISRQVLDVDSSGYPVAFWHVIMPKP